MEPSLERYLNRATLGLWGIKKRHVRTEISGNIREAMLEYQLQGYTAQDSLLAALRDFGDARKLALQLTEVHTMPILHKTALLAGVAAAAILIAVSSAAPLEISRIAPLPDCRTVNPEAAVNAAFNCSFEGTWIKLSDLRREVEAAGGAIALERNQLTIRFAEDTVTVTFSVANPEPLTPAPGGMPEYVIHSFLSFERGGDTFISLGKVIHHIIEQSRLPIRLSNWLNPVLRVGDTKIELGTAASPFVANALYTQGLHQALRAELPNRDRATDVGTILGVQFYDATPDRAAAYLYERHRIALNDSSDGVYAFVSQNFTGAMAGTFLYTIVQSQKGVIEVYLPSKKALFVTALTDVARPASALEGYVAVLKLSGALNGKTFALVQPRQPSSQAVPR